MGCFYGPQETKLGKRRVALESETDCFQERFHWNVLLISDCIVSDIAPLVSGYLSFLSW